MQFFNRVELPMVNYDVGSPMLPMLGRQISDYLPASGFKTTLTWIPFCCLFFIASLGAFLNTSCQLSLFLLCGELDCWLGHGQSRVQGCEWRYWLLGMVFIEDANHLPKVHNDWKKILGVLFSWVTLPYNQII